MNINVIDTEATCKNIKEKMEEKGLTPREIQRELKLDSIQAVYKWLNPRYKAIPSIDNFVQLSHILDCKLDDLIVEKEIDNW